MARGGLGEDSRCIKAFVVPEHARTVSKGSPQNHWAGWTAGLPKHRRWFYRDRHKKGVGGESEMLKMDGVSTEIMRQKDRVSSFISRRG